MTGKIGKSGKPAERMLLFTARVVLASRRSLPAGRSAFTSASKFNAATARAIPVPESTVLWPKPLQDPDLVRELDRQRARCTAADTLPPPHGVDMSATAPRLMGAGPEEERQNLFDSWCLEGGGMNALEAAYRVAPPAPGHLALVTELEERIFAPAGVRSAPPRPLPPPPPAPPPLLLLLHLHTAGYQGGFWPLLSECLSGVGTTLGPQDGLP